MRQDSRGYQNLDKTSSQRTTAPALPQPIQEIQMATVSVVPDEEREGSSTPTFAASRGWFHRFKQHSNLHNIHIIGEAASADIQAAVEFPDNFQEFVGREKIPACLIFNVDDRTLLEKNAISNIHF
ncbi:Jerky protein homolog-like [Eumeta japonica]|uniref:Jerky protein homolog-like n=1 Tax=Eumeta variegata TaxID=151549 RepID=A0A4C2A5E0_EUMVA|nr:Jerky protein homolog-like [Eumeta japonica]